MAKPPPSTVDHVVSLAKRRGFVYPCGEIYGGTRSAWDYGPLGVELKENIKRQWWKSMVTMRDDMVGLDSSIILPRQVWEASGHVDTFTDPLTECQSCHKRFRADHLQEEVAEKKGPRRTPTTSTSPTVACPNCGTRGAWTEPRQFSGLLKTYLGVIEDESGLHYLRPETAQGIFVNFANVVTSSRQKPPFGIAQIGKSFRNEITPGNFIFRTREFEQMEMEFFVKPGEDEEWHQYWIDERTQWYVDLGIDADNLRHYEHPQEKLSHYSKRTVDIEYRFRFAGSEWGELEGIANRTDFDLATHAKHSGQDLSYFDQANNERYTPYVIEPAAGLSRSLMTFLVDAYTEDEAPNTKGGVDKRTVLRARPAARAGQGRGAAAVAQRRPVAEGQGPGDGAAQRGLERRLRRLRRDRPPLPPPGRDRYAVLRDRRLRDPRGPRGDDPRARHHGAGADLPRRGHVVLRRAFRRLLSDPRVQNGRHDEAVPARRRCGAVLALSLAGCSSGDGDPEADGSAGAHRPPPRAPRSTCRCPTGVELTPPGSQLAVGDSAVVAYEPRQDEVGALDITVRKLEQADDRRPRRRGSSAPAQKKSTPYYVARSIENVGDTDLGGRRGAALRRQRGQRARWSRRRSPSSFKPCPSTPFPKKFGPGDSGPRLPGLPRARQGRAGRRELPARRDLQPDHLDR